jgi:Skp family chaperone for outer membrane proteins
VGEIFQPMKNTLDFKSQELNDLKKQHDEGKIDDDTYKKRTLMVEAELTEVPINWYISLIKKMTACQEFSDVKESLERVQDEISSLKDKVGELKSVADKGDLNTFLSTYQGLSSTLQQLDQLMTQIIQALLVDVAGRIAKENHYALVLEKQNVLYLDEGKLVDITPQVKDRLPELFSQ